MLEKLYEIYDDLSVLKPEIVDIRKEGVYAYNTKFIYDSFIYFAPDEFDNEFCLDYQQSNKIINRLKSATDASYEVKDGSFCVQGKGFHYELPKISPIDNIDSIRASFDLDSINFVQISQQFLDSMKKCSMISKIGPKIKSKDIVIKNNKVVTTDGTVLIASEIDESFDFAITERIASFINTIKPTKGAFFTNKIIFDYAGSYILVPKISYKINRETMVNGVYSAIENVYFIEITNEMVNKLQSIGKISDQVQIDIDKGKICFIADDYTSFEECAINDNEFEFSGKYYTSKLIPFFTEKSRFSIFPHGAGYPLVIQSDNSIVLTSNIL